MDVLVSLGTNAAYIYSIITMIFRWVRASQGASFDGPDYFETSALLISFLSLGKLLEVRAKGSTSEASKPSGPFCVILLHCALQSN